MRSCHVYGLKPKSKHESDIEVAGRGEIKSYISTDWITDIAGEEERQRIAYSLLMLLDVRVGSMISSCRQLNVSPYSMHVFTLCVIT